MALTGYQTSVQLLLHDPNAQFFSLSTLNNFIAQARLQIALEGECIRGAVGFNTVNAVETYALATAISPVAPAGIGALSSIRSISYGGLTLEARSWDYFNFYMRNMAKPASGAPKVWCPFIQGSTGNFSLSPVPNAAYNIEIDGIWLPIALANDATAEAIPFPWTDAIQFYAAYLALKDSQRTNDAERMFLLYEQYMARARGEVTPYPTPSTFPGGIAARSSLPGSAPPNRGAIGTQPQPAKT